MADVVGTPAANADLNGIMEQISQLQDELALERAKNEVLLEQVLKAEDGLAEKDVEAYGDVIPNEDRDFWRGQLLSNRDSAVGILNRMRNRAKPDEGKSAGTAPKPLHNRETAKTAVAEKASSGGVDRAAKLRNRAQEIAKRDGCSFTTAFRAAEQELLA